MQQQLLVHLSVAELILVLISDMEDSVVHLPQLLIMEGAADMFLEVLQDHLVVDLVLLQRDITRLGEFIQLHQADLVVILHHME